VTTVLIDPTLDGMTSLSSLHIPIFPGDGIYIQCSQGQIIILAIKEADEMCTVLILHLNVASLMHSKESGKSRKVADLRGSLGSLTCC
jgi:hypothetical protein